MSAPYKYVCRNCDSDTSVSTRAWVYWDADDQTWVFMEHWEDDIHCNYCGEVNDAERVPTTDLRIAAQHAILQTANAP